MKKVRVSIEVDLEIPEEMNEQHICMVIGKEGCKLTNFVIPEGLGMSMKFTTLGIFGKDIIDWETNAVIIEE